MESTGNKGRIFNIQKFSVHDGPGVRDTVFMKGCPLHCIWCSNPESQSPLPQIGWRAKKCIGCGVCAARCPVQAIDPVNPRSTDAEKCIGCMRCISVCPHAARSLDPQILAEVNAMLSQAASDRKSCELFTG